MKSVTAAPLPGATWGPRPATARCDFGVIRPSAAPASSAPLIFKGGRAQEGALSAIRNFPVVVAAAIILASILVGFLARWQLLSRLARHAERTPWAADTVVVASMRWPLPIWCLLGGIYAAKHLLALPAPVSATLARVLLALLVVSTSVWVASLLGRALELRGTRAGHLRPASSTGVVRTLVQIVVWAIGTLILLSALGISVTPLLTTMGLGGLAVALGLRETLANLFAGMNFMLAGNINIGDFVKLSSGEEGTIEDIQWRVTRVRTQFDTMVLIPNNRLADSVVTNYHQPTSRVAVVVPVRVHSASDLDQVEQVTRAVARRIVATVPGGVPEVEPLVRYRAFGDSSVDFNVIFRVHTYPDTQLVRHEFIKALVRAYAAEEIVIPFPVRAINLAQEGGDADLASRRPPPPEPRFDDH